MYCPALSRVERKKHDTPQRPVVKFSREADLMGSILSVVAVLIWFPSFIFVSVFLGQSYLQHLAKIVSFVLPRPRCVTTYVARIAQGWNLGELQTWSQHVRIRNTVLYPNAFSKCIPKVFSATVRLPVHSLFHSRTYIWVDLTSEQDLH